MSPTQTMKTRGYALLLVLLVLTLMAIAASSMAALLATTIAEGRRTTATIRVDLACGSALDLAAHTLNARLATDPSADPAELTTALCNLSPCTTRNGVRLPTALAPPGSTMEHFAIGYDSQTRKPSQTVTAGPFAGHIAVEQTLLVTVALTDTLSHRSCLATDRYTLPSIPLASFPLFGTAPRTRWRPPLAVRRVNDGAPSRAHLNGNKSGAQISTSDFDFPGPQFAGDVDPVDLIASTRGSDAVLSPPVGSPPASAAQGPLERSMHWLVEPPKVADSESLRLARLSMKADVVVVDGVWYNNRDKSLPWPGKPIWSDHPGNGVTHTPPADDVVESTDNIGVGDLGFAAGEFPTRFSWYDRPAPTSPIQMQTAGILSYGPLAVVTSSPVVSCSVDTDCTSPFECYRPTNAAGTCQRVEPGVWHGATVGCGGGSGFKAVGDCSSADAVVDGARSGFRDAGRNILPINFDVGELSRALMSPDRNELGWALGVPSGGPARFNGVIFVTSRFSGSLPRPDSSAAGVGPAALCARSNGNSPSVGSCPGAANNSQHRPLSIPGLPVGLCSSGTNLTTTAFAAPMPCGSASRPNALRVFNAAQVPAASFPRGLTIATDLPLYVYGDVNRVFVTTPPTPQVKVALVGDRITFLSRGWRDNLNPWNDSPATPLATGRMTVEATLVSGLPMLSGDVHDIADFFRTPQTWNANHFLLRGHLVAAFNSEFDARDSDDDDDEDGDGVNEDEQRVDGGLRWLPDYHLDNPGFQPPGLPLVNLAPSNRWRQR